MRTVVLSLLLLVAFCSQTMAQNATCTPAQQACIDQTNSTACAQQAGCQVCDKSLSTFRCQPTTRCLTATTPTGIAWPIVKGYVAPTLFEVGGMGNCAVVADCYFGQQACLSMGSDDMGQGDQTKCNAFAMDSRYTQQGCTFCTQSNAAGTLTVKDCTYTPRVSCIDTTESPPVTRSNTCSGSTPGSSTGSIPNNNPGTPTAPGGNPTGKNSTATNIMVSMVSIGLTAVTVVVLA